MIQIKSIRFANIQFAFTVVQTTIFVFCLGFFWFFVSTRKNVIHKSVHISCDRNARARKHKKSRHLFTYVLREGEERKEIATDRPMERIGEERFARASKHTHMHKQTHEKMKNDHIWFAVSFKVGTTAILIRLKLKYVALAELFADQPDSMRNCFFFFVSLSFSVVFALPKTQE